MPFYMEPKKEKVELKLFPFDLSNLKTQKVVRAPHGSHLGYCSLNNVQGPQMTETKISTLRLVATRRVVPDNPLLPLFIQLMIEFFQPFVAFRIMKLATL